MANVSHSRSHAAKPSSVSDLPLNRLPVRSFGLQAKSEASETEDQSQGDTDSVPTTQRSTTFGFDFLTMPFKGSPTPGFQAKPQPNRGKPQSQDYQPKSFGHDFTTTPFLQPKLTVGAVDDPYEQEADRVAAEVVQRINHLQSSESGSQQQQGSIDTVQRQEMPEEDEELMMKPIPSLQREGELEDDDELMMKPIAGLQRQEMPEDDEDLQMKSSGSMLLRQDMPEEEEELMKKPMARVQREAMEEEELQMQPQNQRVGAAGGAVSDEFEQELNTARGGGQSLAPELQTQMGQVMGADFSGVRVHTDERSDSLNQAVGARAFTTGQDLFFKQGEYQPGSQGGQELIAHELTHVMQQKGTTIQRKIGPAAPVGTVVKRTTDNVFFSIVKASLDKKKKWTYRIQHKGKGNKVFVRQNHDQYVIQEMYSYDYVFIGAGATTAYYIQENMESLKGKSILVIGPDQPWAGERGPGNINHPSSQIVPNQPPEQGQGLAARASFSEWVEHVLTSEGLNIRREKSRVESKPKLDDGHYKIEFEAEKPPIKAKNVILAIGIGPHAKPRGYGELEESNKGLREDEHNSIQLPKVMSLDEFQVAVERLKATFTNFADQNDQQQPVMILVGPNAGIDAVTTYARELANLAILKWIAKPLRGIPFLKGTDNAKGKVEAGGLDENLITDRFASVEIESNKVVAKTKGDSISGDLLVYALGPEKNFLDQFLPEGTDAEQLEPIYDRSNRIRSAHDSSDESDLGGLVKAWFKKEYDQEPHVKELTNLVKRYKDLSKKEAINVSAPDFGRKYSNLAATGNMDASVVGLQVPQSKGSDAPSFKILGGSAYRLAEKVSYRHHSESINRIIEAAQLPENHITHQVLEKVKEVENLAEDVFKLLSSRKEDERKEGEESHKSSLKPALRVLDNLHIEMLAEFVELPSSQNSLAQNLSHISRYVYSLIGDIQRFDGRNNPLQSSTHMNEIATTHPINVALGDQLTSVMSQVGVASEQEPFISDSLGAMDENSAISDEYIEGEKSFTKGRNLTIDDATTIAKFIATQYPDIPPVIADGMTRHIIWDRRYGHPEEAVPAYDLSEDKANTITQYNYQENWKAALSELNQLSADMLGD